MKDNNLFIFLCAPNVLCYSFLLFGYSDYNQKSSKFISAEKLLAVFDVV